MTGASEAIAVDGLAGSILSDTTLEAVGDRFHKAVVTHGYTASACRAFAPGKRRRQTPHAVSELAEQLGETQR